MSTLNTKLKKVVLTARMHMSEDAAVASLESLSLEGAGETESEAQDDLVLKLSVWIQENDGRGELEQALLEAGFEGVDEDTEVHLEFAEG